MALALCHHRLQLWSPDCMSRTVASLRSVEFSPRITIIGTSANWSNCVQRSGRGPSSDMAANACPIAGSQSRRSVPRARHRWTRKILPVVFTKGGEACAVDRLQMPDCLRPVGEQRRACEIGLDVPQPLNVEHRPDIVQDHATDPLRRNAGQDMQNEAAARGADEAGFPNRKMVEQQDKILALRAYGIGWASGARSDVPRPR